MASNRSSALPIPSVRRRWTNLPYGPSGRVSILSRLVPEPIRLRWCSMRSWRGARETVTSFWSTRRVDSIHAPNLMGELEKISRLVAREVDGAPHEVLLVLDATVGQNGFVQAREFLETAGVTGIVLTKLDGTAKGGIAVAIAAELGLPIRFVGVGEELGRLAALFGGGVRRGAVCKFLVSLSVNGDRSGRGRRADGPRAETGGANKRADQSEPNGGGGRGRC